MATEHVLRLRIQNAAKAAQRANERQDQRAYEQAKAAYEAADAALRKLEDTRNLQAIEELEAKARPIADHVGISYADIVESGVPIEVLAARGWGFTGDVRGGMFKKPKRSHLTLVPDPQEPDGVA